MATHEGSRFSRALYRIDALLGVGACAILFAMMSLTFVDVVQRYLFNKSVPGSFEITELMMAVLIFAGLPLVSRREEHVTVDLIDHLLGPRARRVHRVIIELLSGLILLGLAHLMWLRAARTAGYGDTTTILEIKLAPFVYGMTFFLAVAGIVHLIKALTPPASPSR